jgi:hypothetical protein
MAIYSKEVILDDILGEDHVGLTILYYPQNISGVMTIWKWPLIQTIINGNSLHALLCSYDKNSIHEVDERVIRE